MMGKPLCPYTDLLDHPNSGIAFVCGAGTSLELDYAQHPRKDIIHKHTVISVNSSIMMMPWGSGSIDNRYWISNDALCRRWGYWRQVMSANAIKIVRDSWKPYFSDIPDFYQFWPRPTSENIIQPKDLGLAYCSSVPSAIDFCIQSGYKKIVLLGVDHYMIDGKSHFWQFWSKDKWPSGWQMLLSPKKQQQNVFENYNQMAFSALDDFAKIKSVEIINTNPKSNVEVFDKLPLDQVLYEFEGHSE